MVRISIWSQPALMPAGVQDCLTESRAGGRARWCRIVSQSPGLVAGLVVRGAWLLMLAMLFDTGCNRRSVLRTTLYPSSVALVTKGKRCTKKATYMCSATFLLHRLLGCQLVAKGAKGEPPYMCSAAFFTVISNPQIGHSTRVDSVDLSPSASACPPLLLPLP
jgi:hypothetical protein